MHARMYVYISFTRDNPNFSTFITFGEWFLRFVRHDFLNDLEDFLFGAQEE